MNEVILTKAQISAFSKVVDEEFPASTGDSQFKVQTTNLHGGTTLSIEKVASKGRSSGQTTVERSRQLRDEAARAVLVSSAGRTNRIQG